MPTQDRVRSDETVTTQCAGQPPHERGEHGPVRPIQARTRLGATQDGDLVTQHEELDVLGGGRAAHQQDQSEYVRKDQVQQPQRHVGIMPTRRSPLVSDPGPTSGTPHGCGASSHRPGMPGGERQPGRSSGRLAARCPESIPVAWPTSIR
jgi:hypothetical protein